MQTFYGLLATGLFIVSIHLIVTYQPTIGWAILPFPLVFTICSVLIVINLYRREIVIDEEQITCINLFSTEVLPLAGIKGSRVGQKIIELEANSPAGAKIRISNYNDFTDSAQLASWAKDNFKDLNAIDLAAGKANALEDPNLGASESDRLGFLKQKKAVATTYNIAGVVAGFCMIFLPPLPVTIVGVVVPLVGVLLMAFGKGIIKYFADPKRSIYTLIIIGLVLPCFVLFIRSFDAYTVTNLSPLWLAGLGLAAITFFLLYILGINPSIGGIPTQMVLMLIPAVFWGFGAVRMINGVFDRSAPRYYRAIIQNRQAFYGRGSGYYLELTPWGDSYDYKKIKVGRAFYDSVDIDDTVQVIEHPGLLHIAWFTVSKRK